MVFQAKGEFKSCALRLVGVLDMVIGGTGLDLSLAATWL